MPTYGYRCPNGYSSSRPYSAPRWGPPIVRSWSRSLAGLRGGPPTAEMSGSQRLKRIVCLRRYRRCQLLWRDGAGRPEGRPARVVRPAWAAARGCESPVAQMTVTTSRGQLRHREVGWGGSRRRSRDLTDRNRIEGGAGWASRQRTAKPVVIKRPSRKCGGCATKVAVLIRGDLHGCSGMPDQRGRRVEGTAAIVRSLLAVEKSAAAVVPAGIGLVAGKGQTQSRGRGTFGLVGVAVSAAIPARGLGGRAGG